MVRALAVIGRLFSRIFLVILFVSAFWVVGVSGEVLFADFTEADLEGSMSWGQFLDNCVEGGTPYNSGGFFDDIEMHLIVDTDKETVTGSLSGGGSYSNNVNLYTQDYLFDGSISGTAKRTYWAGHMWEWVFEADVELDLSFSTSYRCNTATPGVYTWVSREETVHVTKMLRADTAADDNKQFGEFRISWKDYDEQYDTPISFTISYKNENEQRRAILPLEMPDPIDLSIEVSGPELIGKGSTGEVFRLDVSGEQQNMIKKVYWYLRDWDEGFGEYRWFKTFEQSNLNDLLIDSGEISEWMGRVNQFGESGVDGKSLRMQVSVEVQRDENEWILLTKGYNFTITSSEVVEEARYQITGLNQPLKFIQVEIESDKGAHETVTDKDGYFVIPPNIADASEIEVNINFVYQNNGKEYYKLLSGGGQEDPVLLLLSVKNNLIDSVTLENHIGNNNVKLKASPTKLDDINLDVYLTSENGLNTYISIYQHTTEALEFYKDYLGEDLNYKLPIGIHPFEQPGEGIAYMYQEDKVGIVIYSVHSKHDSKYRPINREYHEFSHYAMHAIYGFLPGDPTTSESINHDGYLNPDTGDSYAEGFAHFMSVIINEYYMEKTGEPYDPDKCGAMGNLDDDMKPWEKNGRGEEWAIAGILWDLYDTDSHQTESKVAIEIELGDNFDKMLFEVDLDDNGKLETLELLYHVLTPLANRRGIYLRDYGEYDRNYDEVFDKEEIQYMFRLNEEGKTPFLEKADFDKDGEVNYDELFHYIGVQESERFSKQYTEAELESLIADMKKQGLPSEFDKQGWIDYNWKQLKQDESISLPFSEIWSILRTPKKNFYEVYQAFITKYPNHKTDIDSIFVKHGFWQDKNPGNGKIDENEPHIDKNNNDKLDEGEPFIDYPVDGFKYDIGEIIGPAADYIRQERKSTVELPGQKVKVDNSVPFFSVLIDYYSDGVNSSPVPLRIVEFEVENIDGYIYIPFPPEAYEAIITIEPIDVEFTRILQVSSQEFHQNYTDFVEQGFYVEHDFNVIGEIPEPPVNPYYVDFTSEEQPSTDTTETETETPEEPDSQGGGIPSFPLVSMVLGVSMLLLLYRKRV